MLERPVVLMRLNNEHKSRQNTIGISLHIRCHIYFQNAYNLCIDKKTTLEHCMDTDLTYNDVDDVQWIRFLT